MSWRTVIITGIAKLDYQMDFLVIRKQTGASKVFIDEINTLIIESTMVSLTTALLCELSRNKVKVIFCDEKHNPNAELVPYYGSHDTSAKVRKQILWDEYVKKTVWAEIIGEKIRLQANHLHMRRLEKQESLLRSYLSEIKPGDETNREGHAAKVYFNALFGLEFTRTADIPVNAALNYGYGIILSHFTREIVANGYITQLGIFHDNMFNQFNLASDLMEPFRILVDKKVYDMMPEKFDAEEKREIVDIVNQEVIIDGKRNYVVNAMKIYCRSIFDALNEGDVSLIRFYRDEL